MNFLRVRGENEDGYHANAHEAIDSAGDTGRPCFVKLPGVHRGYDQCCSDVVRS